MLITRKQLEESLLNILPDKEFYLKKENKSDLNLAIKYILEDEEFTEEEKKRLEELYRMTIERCKEQSKLNVDIVKNVVSFISLAPIKKEIYKELPFEKSLRIFPNIEKMYLIYSEVSKDRFSEVKTKLEKKFIEEERKIEIIGKLISWDRIEEIHNYLLSLVKEGYLTSENSILDLTLGMKITGIAMYKLAVVRDIKIINWKASFFPKYEYIKEENAYNAKTRVESIPFSETLEVLKEPIKESRKQYFLLNKMIDERNYKVLAEYYLNFFEKEDLYFFFKELSNVFSFETIFMFEVEEFYKKVKKFCKMILEYNKFCKMILEYNKFEENTKNKIKNFVYILELISDLDKETYHENYYKLNLSEQEEAQLVGILKEAKKFLKKKNSISFEEAMYIVMISQFIMKNIKVKSKRAILFENIKDILLINIKGDKFKDRLKDFDEIEKFLFEKSPQKLWEIFAVSENFKENFEKEIAFENGILKLDNFGIKIDLAEEDELKNYFGKNRKYKKLMRVFETLISKENYYLSSKETEVGLLPKDGNRSSLDKESSNLLKLLNKINGIVCEKTGQDFIFTNKKLKKELKKNEFRINNVFYE